MHVGVPGRAECLCQTGWRVENENSFRDPSRVSGNHVFEIQIFSPVTLGNLFYSINWVFVAVTRQMKSKRFCDFIIFLVKNIKICPKI